MHIVCIYNNWLFFLAQQTLKTRLVLQEHQNTGVLALHCNGSSKPLRFLSTLEVWGPQKELRKDPL